MKDKGLTTLDIIKTKNFIPKEKRMVKVRFKKNGYQCEMTEQMARIMASKGKIDYIKDDIKPPTPPKVEPPKETKTDIYEFLKNEGVELKNIQAYKLDELKEMAEKIRG